METSQSHTLSHTHTRLSHRCLPACQLCRLHIGTVYSQLLHGCRVTQPGGFSQKTLTWPRTLSKYWLLLNEHRLGAEHGSFFFFLSSKSTLLEDVQELSRPFVRVSTKSKQPYTVFYIISRTFDLFSRFSYDWKIDHFPGFQGYMGTLDIYKVAWVRLLSYKHQT